MTWLNCRPIKFIDMPECFAVVTYGLK